MRYPGARVIAVEASESNFNLLVRNTSAFPNIEPVHAALWPQPGSLVLTDPGTGLWGLQVTDAGAQESVRQSHRPGLGPRDHDPRYSPRLPARKDRPAQGGYRGQRERAVRCARALARQVDAICIELHDWFKAGCSRAFFSAVEDFSVEAWRGENVLVARA